MTPASFPDLIQHRAKGGFAFDPESHLYTIKGARVLSTTESFHQSGLVDITWFTEESRDRGSAAHAAVEYYIDNDLDTGDLHADIRPRLDAFRSWESDFGFTPIPEMCEEWDVHPIWLYGGKWDVMGMARGSLWLIDMKTGAAGLTAELQTAAYANLPLVLPFRPRRGSLELRKDASYRFKEHTDKNDFQTFLAALNLARWRMSKGIRPSKGESR